MVLTIAAKVPGFTPLSLSELADWQRDARTFTAIAGH
jgi:hypothetical protein